MANFFGFNREDDILSEYTIRKLGLSGSYDTSAMIVLLALFFYFLSYLRTKKPLFILLIILAFFSIFFTSRTGIILGSITYVFFLIHLLLTSKRRLIIISIILTSIIIYYKYIHDVFYLIILRSFGINDDITNEYTVNYGTTGTLDGLTSTHLDALNQPFFDLLIGLAIDPNMTELPTDIGYIKIIYHIGIIGLLTIISIYFYILKATFNIRSKSEKSSATRLLSNFLLFYTVILLIMNYKGLILYSRGAHDLLIIIYFFISNSHFISPRHNKSVNNPRFPQYYKEFKK
jgi:hypothetical protein